MDTYRPPYANNNNDPQYDSKPLSDTEYVFNSQRQKVNTNTFYKIRWGTKCQNEMDIIPFYRALQHVASTCVIPLRNLDNIDEVNGVYPLTVKNCKNYDKFTP